MPTIPPVVAAQACLVALVLDAAADVLPDRHIGTLDAGRPAAAQ